mgnify:CR=1 FL=1
MKKIVLRVITILISIILISFIIIEGLIIIEGRNISTKKVDYVIVLGARLYGDIPSPSLQERLNAAREYLIENNDIKVVVSGGHGIENDRIILEDKSTTTFENLKMSVDKIMEVYDKENLSVLIATNRYHVFRSKLLAKRLGLMPYGLPAKTPPTTVLFSYVREYFAVIKSLLFDKI